MTYGLEKAGFWYERIQSVNRKTNLERFASFYGVNPKTCVAIYTTLKESDGLGRTTSVLYFLLTMAWLKTYSAEHVLAAIFGVTENTVRKWTWINLKALQSLKETKVRKINAWLYNLPFFISYN